MERLGADAAVRPRVMRAPERTRARERPTIVLERLFARYVAIREPDAEPSDALRVRGPPAAVPAGSAGFAPRPGKVGRPADWVRGAGGEELRRAHALERLGALDCFLLARLERLLELASELAILREASRVSVRWQHCDGIGVFGDACRRSRYFARADAP